MSLLQSFYELPAPNPGITWPSRTDQAFVFNDERCALSIRRDELFWPGLILIWLSDGTDDVIATIFAWVGSIVVSEKSDCQKVR